MPWHWVHLPDLHLPCRPLWTPVTLFSLVLIFWAVTSSQYGCDVTLSLCVLMSWEISPGRYPAQVSGCHGDHLTLSHLTVFRGWTLPLERSLSQSLSVNLMWCLCILRFWREVSYWLCVMKSCEFVFDWEVLVLEVFCVCLCSAVVLLVFQSFLVEGGVLRWLSHCYGFYAMSVVQKESLNYKVLQVKGNF